VRKCSVPLGRADTGVDPDTRRTPAWCKRPTKSRLSCSICSAVKPVRASIALSAGGGWFIRRGSTPMVGPYGKPWIIDSYGHIYHFNG
jgi:hypothetical protein